MSITDELREWAFNELSYKTRFDALTAIADRIDAKHERTFRNLTDALHKQEDATRELDEKSVLLPVDADGEVIHIGDRVENNERVVRIVLTDGSWEPSVYVEKRPNVLDENAKLRELVRDMWHEGAFAPGACYVETDRLEERTRELGVEVDA